MPERPRGSPVALLGGGTAHLRPLQPDDRATYLTALDAMSPDTRRHRFGTPTRTLPESRLRRLLSPDGHHHVALAAIDPATGAGLAVGRYQATAGSHTARLSLAVVDRWQGRGLACALLDSLAGIARSRGISAFTVTVDRDNVRARTLAAACGAELLYVDPDRDRLQVALSLSGLFFAALSP